MNETQARNFDCQISGEKCVNPNCSRERCYDSERFDDLANTPHEKIFDKKTYRLLHDLIERMPRKKSI